MQSNTDVFSGQRKLQMPSAHPYPLLVLAKLHHGSEANGLQDKPLLLLSSLCICLAAEMQESHDYSKQYSSQKQLNYSMSQYQEKSFWGSEDSSGLITREGSLWAALS